MRLFILLVTIIVITTTQVFAHSGKTRASDGCHVNRQVTPNVEHCHNKPRN